LKPIDFYVVVRLVSFKTKNCLRAFVFYAEKIMFNKSAFMLCAAATLLLGLAACEKKDDTAKGPAEQAGAQLDAAAAKAGEALNKAGVEAGKELQAAGAQAGEAMKKSGEKLEKASKDAQKKE
jgi:hypothetical protein